MSAVNTEALEKRVNNLAREVAILRSLVSRVVLEKDPEGEYRPSFIRAILKAAKEEPAFEYKGRGSLRKQLRQLK